MEEDTEYKKLPIEERCVHKLWKARVDGYEEAAKLFREIDDEKSTEWNKYVNLIKKFVIDSNAMAQEKGLEATLIFVENCANAGRTVNDVMSGIVQKCIAAPKAKTKDLAVQITLMYIEIEKYDAVLEELLKGTEHKNPKIVSACTSAITLGLKEFGNKVISVKPLIKKLAPLMSDRDKTVREEGKQLAIEIYRWIGAAMKPQIASLPSVTITELENEFDKLKGEKAEPTRYLKSQQEKQQAISADAIDNGVAVDDEEERETEEIDPLDLIDPVDILSKLPKDFYEKLEAKKWQERKESLDCLEKLLENPKLESGDYGDVVKALKKIITKDTNVLLVAMAGKCMAALAKGLGKRFSIYATACISAIFEKFKEKKANVVAALRDAIDAIYPSTSLEAIQEDIVEALNNKNPSVKAETASFLARAFTKTQPTALNKKLLKLLVTALLKTLNEPDPTVRDNSAEALGTLLKLMGEKAVGTYLTDVDALKMAKIKECQEKAVIIVKIAGAKKERPTTAPVVKQHSVASTKGGSVEPRPVSRPATAGVKKSAAGVKKTAGSSGALSKSSSSSKVVSNEKELTPEEVAVRAEEILSSEVLSGLADANWKTRLSASEGFLAQISDIEPKTTTAQILFRTLNNKKPGMKDTNFQVLKVKLDIVRNISEKCPLTSISADFVINEVAEKLGDPKNSSAACQALTAIAEATKLEYVVSKVITFAFDQKSPKVQAEALNWINGAIKEFGFQINPKLLIEDIRKGVQSTNPTVRSAAITLLGTMCMYVGSNLMMYFDNEKSVLRQQIQTEIDKNSGQKPPPPTRGVKASASTTSVTEEDNGVVEEEPYNASDLFPRIDISSQITESLLAEISDKNWKTRNEGLTKLQNILNEAKLIKPTIGDLPQALMQRLTDSNAKIAQTAIAICEQLATAMGSSCKQHIRTLFPGFLHGLGDSKVFIRSASLSCINAWGEQCGFKEFFEGEMVADALKTGSPSLKTELWGWLAEKLPNIPVKTIPREELVAMLPHLYANILDRNADVRKNANEAVLGIMIHLGYEAMVKALDKQKPTSKKDIQAALDKARPNLPMKPLPKGKQAPILEETKSARQTLGGTKSVRGGGGGQQNSKNAEKPTTSRKKEEEIDTSPLFMVNNSKNQRLIDEQKMKVLKWTFTSPREEFSELLKEQMSTACVNKNLMANMFHDDFRYHLKVIEALIEDLPNNPKALTCNLDLILKWLSLRFYDTNPSVLLKGLEYLQMVFQMLVENEHILTENEGSSFIPHLLIKIGDPKDTVRNGVRSLLRQICLVYPVTKVFMYIMDGLKSKNARQRTECLEELSYLIETYGITVCQPTPQVALKEIARHISDRDNSVRNAALNCVVQAYFLQGDKVYKLIGQLNEKDLSMLDERIKRAKKTKKPTNVVVATANNAAETIKQSSGIVTTDDNIEIEDPTVTTTTTTNQDELQLPEDGNSPYGTSLNITLTMETNDENVEERRDMPGKLTRQATFDQPNPQVLVPQQQLLQAPLKPSGPFGLDPNIVAEIEKDWVRVDQMKVIEPCQVDLSFLYEPIKIKSVNGVSYPADRFEKLISKSRIPSPGRHGSAGTPGNIYNAAYNVSPPLSSGMSPYSMMYANNNNSPRSIMSGCGVSSSTDDGYTGESGGGGQFNNVIQNLADTLPKLDPNITRMIHSMASTDRVTSRAAMNELTEILENPDKQAVLRDYEEMFIQSVLAQFKNLSQLPQSESLIMYQPLLSITFEFFNARNLGKALSVSCLKNIMSVLLGLMADQKLSQGEDGKYQKVLNGICLKILDTTNFTNLNCALIRLLKETCPSAGLPKFADLLMKCLWRNVKVMPDRSGELDYDAVLFEVHEFMLALPSTWWQQRPSDTPLRTIKTIIHNMAKIKGNLILQHLNKIPTHSELHAYLIRILKNLQRDENGPSGIGGGSSLPQRSSSGKDLTKDQQNLTTMKQNFNQTHEKISHIFKLISHKETSRQGLLELYEFKISEDEFAMNIEIKKKIENLIEEFKTFIETTNPDVDVIPFLKGASPTFLKYIEDGLAEIEKEQQFLHGQQQQQNQHPYQQKTTTNGDSKLAENIVTNSDHNSGSGIGIGGGGGGGHKLDPDYWMERLNLLRARANINTVKNEGHHHHHHQHHHQGQDNITKNNMMMMMDNKIVDENLNLNQIQQKNTTTIPIMRKDKTELSPNRLEHLQQKLAQLKQQK